MHAKLNLIYSEIQILSDYCDKLDPQSSDYEAHKQMAVIKQENFKKEFRVILNLLQEKQSSQQHISSDEEESLETDVRVRLRSVSIASKNSSNNRKSRWVKLTLVNLQRIFRGTDSFLFLLLRSNKSSYSSNEISNVIVEDNTRNDSGINHLTEIS